MFEKNIKKLLNEINIKPKNLEFYYQAFTDKSYSNENKDIMHLEMLEFLGDALIQAFSSIFIYQLFLKQNIKSDPGLATNLRKFNVNNKKLSSISDKYKLISYRRASKGVMQNQLESDKKKADLFESLCGAIYLDLGFNVLESFLKSIDFFKNIKNTDENDIFLGDPKTSFQEYIQKSPSIGKIKYVTNPNNHSSGFTSSLYVGDKIFGEGQGPKKKDAAKNAAKNALEKLEKI